MDRSRQARAPWTLEHGSALSGHRQSESIPPTSQGPRNPATGGPMNNNSEQQATLVLGGTGKTGRRVVERLRARGPPVRVGSRSGAPPFDWEDRSTWAPALDGVGSVYVLHYL